MMDQFKPRKGTNRARYVIKIAHFTMPIVFSYLSISTAGFKGLPCECANYWLNFYK